MVSCRNCGRTYPKKGAPFRCVSCGGTYDFDKPMDSHLLDEEEFNQSIWKFEKPVYSPESYKHVTLGEGNTPLIWNEINGNSVGFKCEYLNPST